MLQFRLAAVAIVLVVLLAACGGGDDDGDGDNGSSGDSGVGSASPTVTAEAPDSDEPADGSDEFFQVRGTGVLTIVIGDDTHEYDVTCEAANGKTLSDEPQWDYTLESADADVIVRGTYQLVDDEETFKSLSVIDGALIINANSFANVMSGGTEWAGDFTSIGSAGQVEGSFETSCS
jgi:hypothetical protein